MLPAAACAACCCLPASAAAGLLSALPALPALPVACRMVDANVDEDISMIALWLCLLRQRTPLASQRLATQGQELRMRD